MPQTEPLTILVPVDYSDVTTDVIETAVTFAIAFKSKMVLLHVVEPEPEFVGFEPGPATVRVAVADDFHEAHRRLEELKARVAASGVPVAALQLQGPTIEKILHEQEVQRADLIVMGSHGHGALYHLLAGSVTEGVLKAARCRVLVVPSSRG